MVLLEAMMAGKAIVAPRIGGIPEIVENEKTGMLVKPDDPEDLAQKIRYLWEHPRLCRQMGQAGREKALQEYSPQQHYERLMAAYQRAIMLGPPGSSQSQLGSSNIPGMCGQNGMEPHVNGTSLSR